MKETSEILLSPENLSKETETIIMKAIALCFKPYLKPEEAMIYTNLGRTRLAVKCEEYGIFKNDGGYYKKEDLDLILTGGPTKYELEVLQRQQQQQMKRF
jgi:hypothetical protein